MAIVELSQGNELYAELFMHADAAMIFLSPAYIRFLEDVFPKAKSIAFSYEANGKIVAALPALVMETAYGSVLNSLPYFGSHGDVLFRRGYNGDTRILRSIAGEIRKYAQDARLASINIVSNLSAPGLLWSSKASGLRVWDQRIGQVSKLQPAPDRDSALEIILKTCTQKTRNLVRKGLRQDFQINLSEAQEDWDLMVQYHRAAITALGGMPKAKGHFQFLRDSFPRESRQLYVAKSGGEFAGALLVLLNNEWVEYFTPVSAPEFRDKQVMSAIIAVAMQDAMLAGRRSWNWGGTWANQEGVYRFKHGWGAKDLPYSYLGEVFSQGLQQASAAEIVREAPYWYLKPFASGR